MNNIIPKINISELMKNGLSSKRSNKIIKKIETACLGSGFFEIGGHGLKSEVNSILKVCQNFFNLPLNEYGLSAFHLFPCTSLYFFGLRIFL